jgi:hypothetical protein
MKMLNFLFLLAVASMFVACSTTTKERDPANVDAGTKQSQERFFKWHGKLSGETR